MSLHVFGHHYVQFQCIGLYAYHYRCLEYLLMKFMAIQLLGINHMYKWESFGSIVPVCTLGSILKRCIVPCWRFGWIVAIDPNRITKNSEVGIPFFILYQIISLGLQLRSYYSAACFLFVAVSQGQILPFFFKQEFLRFAMTRLWTAL